MTTPEQILQDKIAAARAILAAGKIKVYVSPAQSTHAHAMDFKTSLRNTNALFSDADTTPIYHIQPEVPNDISVCITGTNLIVAKLITNLWNKHYDDAQEFMLGNGGDVI